MDDSYLTIDHAATAEIKVKGSRFIGEAGYAGSLDAATAILTRIQKQFHDATHHCFAYRFGVPVPTTFKYSDDGEPNGTAGKPIYDCLTGRNITNTIVVVTRYFGGTELGTGGLVRAYSDTAIATLESAGTKECFITESVTVELPFWAYDNFVRLLQKFDIKKYNSYFSEIVRVTINVRLSKKAELIKQFVQLTAGKGVVKEKADA